MRRLLSPLVIVFAMALSLVGCGGSGGGTAANSVFQGQYSGTWQAYEEFGGSDPTTAGTVTFFITEKGGVSGFFTETSPLQRSGSVTGKVKADGTLTFQVAYPGGSASYGGQVEKASGAIDGSFDQLGDEGNLFPFFHLEPSDI